MDSCNTSPYSRGQRKVFCILVGGAVLLAAATSFPFRQRSSNAAQPAEASANRETLENAPSTQSDETLVLQQRSIIDDTTTIAPLADAIPTSLLLAKLTNALPAGVWLSRVTLDTHGSAAQLILAVVVRNVEQGHALVTSLRNEPLFQNVRLISAGSADAGNRPTQVQILIKPMVNDRSLPAVNSIDGPAPLDSPSSPMVRVQRDVILLQSLLPVQGSLEPLQNQIVQLAAANSLHMSASRSLPSHELFRCIDQSMEISISGSFNGFYSFLLQLESMPRLKRVTTLQMRESAEHNGDMQATLTLDVFSKLPPP